MDASSLAPNQRSQQEQLVARLLGELRFDDGAFGPDPFASDAEAWTLVEPTTAPALASSALDAADSDWIADIAALMTPEQVPGRVVSAPVSPARQPPAAGPRVERAIPSPPAAPPSAPPVVPRAAPSPVARPAPTQRRDTRAEPFELVTRDGVRYGRFADGAELEYEGTDEHGQPVFLVPRDSVRVLAANAVLPIAGLGLLAAAVLNLHTALGALSSFLPLILPAIAPTFRL
jgi:hypothetical protein